MCVIALPLYLDAQVRLGPSTQRVQQPVYVEDSPAAQDLAEAALELRDQGEYVQAAQKLQSIIEKYPHKLMRTGASSYTDAVLWVRRSLREEERLLSAYRTLFDEEAARMADQAMPTPDRPIDVAALRAVLSQYTLTPAGMRAGLTLSAYHLERAEARDALSVLDDLMNHPDLSEQPGRYHMLRGVALLLIGNRDGYETQLSLLDELGDVTWHDDLQAMAHRVHPTLRRQADLHAVGTASLPSDLTQPLWEIDLLEALWAEAGQRVEVRKAIEDRALLRVRPVVAREHIILNLGDGMIAYDRASGWRQWEVQDQREPTENALMYMPHTTVIEPRGVCVVGDRVYGYLGWVYPNQAARAPGSTGVSLVAANLEDGRERWRVTPGDLDPSFENASFDGTPITGGGRIYTLIKRVQVTGLHDVYLAALDESDGGLVWRRHLSSSSSQAPYNRGPSPRMTQHAGRLYISDNRGAVVSMDGRTGTVRWVTILPEAGIVDVTAVRTVRTRSDVPEPVVTAAGLLIPPIGSGRAYLLLDVETGEVTRTLDDSPWSDVSACYPAGEDVLAIGSASVSLFDGATLDQLWRKQLDVGRDGTVRGRPAIGLSSAGAGTNERGVVVFTTQRRLYALKLNDGQVLADVSNDTAGHVVLAPGQVLVASTIGLHAYTDWQVARQHLLDLVEQHPSDPRPGMALARLALRSGRDAQVLQGIDLALASLTHPPMESLEPDQRQAEVYDLLYDITISDASVNPDLRGELLDRMARSATGPKQEAAYQLTRGRHLIEMNEPARAVEHYQEVLADPSLAAQLYTVGRRSRLAGLEARRQIKGLILSHGREVYRSYDLLAEHELQELISTGEQDAAVYIALADRYPLALSVNRARQYAADRALETGDEAGALRQLQAVYLDTADDADRSQIAGRIAALYLSHDRPEHARHWLRRVKREYPQLLLTDESGLVTAADWLARLDEQSLFTFRQLPRIGLPLSEPTWIDGRPMHSITHVVGADRPCDRVLMAGNGEWWMLSMPGLTEPWRQPIPAQGMRVLAWDGWQVLWWSPQTMTLGAIDSRTGEALWQSVDCRALMERAGGLGMQQERRNRQQQQFLEVLGGTTVRRSFRVGEAADERLIWAVDLSSVVLADHLGRVACIDRDTGRVRWSVLGQADSLTDVAIGDGLVALAGASWVDTAAQHGIITLLDPLTGEQHKTVFQTEQVPIWIAFADNGHLISAMSGTLPAHHVATGLTQWHTDSAIRNSLWSRYRIGGNLLTVAEMRGEVGTLQVVELDDGRVVNQLPVRSAADKLALFDPVYTTDAWYASTQMQTLSLEASGQLRWIDAICAPPGHIKQQYVSDRYVLIVSGTPPRQVPQLPQLNINERAGANQALEDILRQARDRAETSGYRLFVLDRHSGVIERELPLIALQTDLDPSAGAIIDGALLIDSGEKTLVIQGSNTAD